MAPLHGQSVSGEEGDKLVSTAAIHDWLTGWVSALEAWDRPNSEKLAAFDLIAELRAWLKESS